MIDFSEMLDNIRDNIDNIKDAFAGNKRTVIAAAAVLVVMTISAVMILAMTFGKKNEKKAQTAVEQPLELDHALLVPPSPAMPEGYLYSRERGGVWSEQDAQVWFTPPTQSALDELSTANDRMATEITGAAP